MVSKEVVESGCADWATWFLESRKTKLEGLKAETMTVNPLMAPLIAEFHGVDSVEGLINLLVASHLMTGHATSFGKLIDEKILPKVFNLNKLDKKYRSENYPFSNSCFDDIDHAIKRGDGKFDLVSLKASRWTIQLAAAVNLNKSFNEIYIKHNDIINSITIGVFYGKEEDLTDKYHIARGINNGANHDVIDLTKFVFLKSGKDFWSWLNDGEMQTQDWVLNGFIKAAKTSPVALEVRALRPEHNDSVAKSYFGSESFLNSETFKNLLKNISG